MSWLLLIGWVPKRLRWGIRCSQLHACIQLISSKDLLTKVALLNMFFCLIDCLKRVSIFGKMSGWKSETRYRVTFNKPPWDTGRIMLLKCLQTSQIPKGHLYLLIIRQNYSMYVDVGRDPRSVISIWALQVFGAADAARQAVDYAVRRFGGVVLSLYPSSFDGFSTSSPISVITHWDWFLFRMTSFSRDSASLHWAELFLCVRYKDNCILSRRSGD